MKRLNGSMAKSLPPAMVALASVGSKRRRWLLLALFVAGASVRLLVRPTLSEAGSLVQPVIAGGTNNLWLLVPNEPPLELHLGSDASRRASLDHMRIGVGRVATIDVAGQRLLIADEAGIARAVVLPSRPSDERITGCAWSGSVVFVNAHSASHRRDYIQAYSLVDQSWSVLTDAIAAVGSRNSGRMVVRRPNGRFDLAGDWPPGCRVPIARDVVAWDADVDRGVMLLKSGPSGPAVVHLYTGYEVCLGQHTAALDTVGGRVWLNPIEYSSPWPGSLHQAYSYAGKRDCSRVLAPDGLHLFEPISTVDAGALRLIRRCIALAKL